MEYTCHKYGTNYDGFFCWKFLDKKCCKIYDFYETSLSRFWNIEGFLIIPNESLDDPQSQKKQENYDEELSRNTKPFQKYAQSMNLEKNSKT
jgi:hypothetical protein